MATRKHDLPDDAHVITWDATNIYEVLKIIKRCPGLFLHTNTISTLAAYVEGYTRALEAVDMAKKVIPDFAHFSTWVYGRLDRFSLSAGWRENILDYCKYDEKEAYRVVWELLEEFKQVKIRARRVVFSSEQRNVVFHRMEQRKALAEIPHSIIVFTMPPSRCCWYADLDENGEWFYHFFEASAQDMFEGIDDSFNTTEADWQELSEEEALEWYQKIYFTE